MNNVAQSLEGQWGVFRWGGYGLDAVTRITGIDFSQQIHNRLGGKENVRGWNEALYFYQAMKFAPASVEQIEVSEPGLEVLLNRHQDYKVRRYSAFRLSEKGTEKAQEIMVSALNDRDEIIQKLAISSLGRYADYKAVQPLMNYGITDETAAVLMAIDDPRAADIFINGLKSDKEITRAFSSLWLAKSKETTAVPALIEALKNEKRIIYESTPGDIGDLFEQDYNKMNPAVAEIIALASINDPDSIEPLIEIAVSGENIASQQAAIIALGLMADSRAIEPLIGLLNSPNRGVPGLAAAALGNFNTARVKEALDSKLNDQDEVFEVRLKAADYSLRSGEDVPEEFIAKLISLIEGKDNAIIVRKEDYYGGKKMSRAYVDTATEKEVMKILSRIKEPATVSFVNSYSGDQRNNFELRAIAAMGAVDTQGKILEPLNSILDNSVKVNPQFKDKIISNLGKTGNLQAVEPLKRFLLNSRGNSFQTNTLAVASLNKIDPLKTEQILVDVFPRNRDIQFRRATLLGLADSTQPKAIEFGLSSLKYEQPEMRYASLSSLANKANELPVKNAFIDLINHDNDPFMKSRAILGLRNSNDLGVTDTLKFALNDPYPEVKSAAVLALASRADFDTMNKIAKFSSDPNLMVQRTATLSLGQRLTDFPQNADFLIPKLKNNDWQTKQIAMSSLGANINKFPQLKEPFLNIARDNTQPFMFQQSASAYLSNIQSPEIKNLLVSNLNHPDWRMRQVSAFGLSNFKDTDIIPSLKPLLNDKQWQVRQASILPLASNLKAFPELKQPLMNTFQNKNEDLWMRQIAGASLKNAGYSVDFDLAGIKPLGKTIVVFVPGMDDFNPLSSIRPQDTSWSKDLKLRQDFDRLEAAGVAKVFEYNWPENPQDYFKAEKSFVDYAQLRYNDAINSGANSITFVLHSAGNPLSIEGIDRIKELSKENNMKINIIGMGSPNFRSDERFRDIADFSEGQYRTFWSPFDWVSWPSAFSQNRQMVLGSHGDYFNNLEFRQTALSMSTGRDIPISYSRTAYGSISDQYFSATYQIQQIKSVYSSGITTYQTKEWYTYRSGQQLISSNLYNRISPLPPMQPIRQPTLPSIPRVPSGGIGRRP